MFYRKYVPYKSGSMARTCVRSDNARALYVASVLSRVHAHDCTHARTRSMLKLTFFTLACLKKLIQTLGADATM